MKKVQLLLLSLILSVFTFAHDDEKDPIVLKIDGEGIHASEFLYIYSKNNPNPSFKKKDFQLLVKNCDSVATIVSITLKK